MRCPYSRSFICLRKIDGIFESEETDGADNVEREPDILYFWSCRWLA
jgi:hypothetical protein